MPRFQFRMRDTLFAVVIAVLCAASVEMCFRVAREHKRRQFELLSIRLQQQVDSSEERRKMGLLDGAIRAEEWQGNPNRTFVERGRSLSLTNVERDAAEFKRRQQELNREIARLEARLKQRTP